MQWLVQASLPGCGSQRRAEAQISAFPWSPSLGCSGRVLRKGFVREGGSCRKQRKEPRATCGPGLFAELIRCSDGEKLCHQGSTTVKVPTLVPQLS